jgi:hypothetical protein
MNSRHFHRFVFCLCISPAWGRCLHLRWLREVWHIRRPGWPTRPEVDVLQSVRRRLGCWSSQLPSTWCPLVRTLPIVFHRHQEQRKREKEKKWKDVNNKRRSSSLGKSTKWRQAPQATSATFGASPEYDLAVIKEFRIFFITTIFLSFNFSGYLFRHSGEGGKILRISKRKNLQTNKWMSCRNNLVFDNFGGVVISASLIWSCHSFLWYHLTLLW